jgi:hypothetical protein
MVDEMLFISQVLQCHCLLSVFRAIGEEPGDIAVYISAATMVFIHLYTDEKIHHAQTLTWKTQAIPDRSEAHLLPRAEMSLSTIHRR